MGVIGVAMALTLTAMGCNEGPASDPSSAPSANSYYDQRLSWTDCGGGFQCAKANVPLDYAKPTGEQLSISLIRLPAQNQSERIGSLFTNPGGPGGSGVNFIRQAARSFGQDLRNRFDIIGFDPRGVGESNPVRCLDGPQLDQYFATDTTPDDQKEVQALATQGERFAQGCQGKSANRLPYVGTQNAARDIDVLRAAVGDKKLTYYGASYGTYLGAFYAEQFPKNVRALVLDGAVDPRVSSTQLLVEQSKGFETALQAFAADCTAQPDCPLGTEPADVPTRISTLLKQLDQTPLTNRRDARKVTESWATLGIATALYAKEYWPQLKQAFAQALQQKDGTLFLSLADQLVERRPDGTYSNQSEANMAVNCVDKPNPKTLAEYRKSVNEANKESPLFGQFVVWGGLGCVYWPIQTAPTPKPIQAKGSAPILVIGTQRDPATPYRWSQNLTAQLDNATLLTLDGDGHTAYLQANPCITKTTDTYLTTTKLPPQNTICH